MKIVTVADTHISARTHETDRGVFSGIISKTLEFAPEYFVIAGDLFDSPVPSSREVLFVMKHLGILTEAKITVILLTGNHDISNVGNALNYLAYRDRILIVEEKPLFLRDQDGSLLGFVPYSRAPIVEMKKAFDQCCEDFAEIPNATFYHGLIQNVRVSDTFRFLSGEDVLPSNLISEMATSFFVAGDVHLRQVLKIRNSELIWAGYVGCPWEHNFSEEGYETGFLVIDGSDIQFYESAGTKHFTVRVNDKEEAYQAMDAYCGRFDHIKLRFLIPEVLTSDHRKEIKVEGAKRNIEVSFKEEQTTGTDIRTLIREQSGARKTELLPLLDVWIRSQTSDTEMIRRVIEEGRKLLNSAEII